jgi:predicted transcriptional regulator
MSDQHAHHYFGNAADQSSDSDVSSSPPVPLEALTAKIVAGYVGSQRVATEQVTDLIQTVADTMRDLTGGKSDKEPVRPIPAVRLSKAIEKDRIACLVCGQRFMTLKQHLRKKHGLTPEGYRQTFGLSPLYPIVSETYRNFRRDIALRTGLGRKQSQT